MDRAFLDTSFAIALAVRDDTHHQRALELSKEMRDAGTRLITTRAVILEIGNALSKRHYRASAAVMLSGIDSDPSIVVLPLTIELYQQAFDLYRNRPDKDWSPTDCISFTVMEERGITDTLTADDHFRQAGFRALLKEK